MKHLAIVLALALLLSLPTFAGELTIKEAEEFFAQPQQLYEPPDEEFNKSMEQSVKEDPSLAEMLTPTKGYYYPAVNIYKIWEKAGIEPKSLQKDSKEFLFGYEVGMDKKYNLRYPETKLYANDNYKILRVGSSSSASTADYQFLIFKKQNNKWVYFDYVYALYEKYTEPELIFLDNTLFYIKQLGGSGTGIVEYMNIFYAILDNKVEQLLYCPANGHMVGWGTMFNRGYESETNYSKRVLSINYSIKVDANPYYHDSAGNSYSRSEYNIFNVKRKAVFDWNGKSLAINDDKSQFTLDDMENIFYGGGKEYYAMFKTEFDKMKDGNDEQKEWYGLFIEERE